MGGVGYTLNVSHLVQKSPDLLNSYFDLVTWSQPLLRFHGVSDSGRSTCENNATCPKSGSLAAELDNLRDVVHHV